MIHEPAHVLSIGSVVGGSTAKNRRWREAIANLTGRVATARRGVSSPLNVNVVFQVPGAILNPDFAGVRTGRFSKDERLLLVQVALPEEVPDEPEGYLRMAVVTAIHEAERWACKREIAPDLAALRALADRL